MTGKRIGIGITGGAVVALSAFSVAWACTYQPTAIISQDSGPANSRVTVSGHMLKVGTQTIGAPDHVVAKWDDGSILGTAPITEQNGAYTYSLPVIIPAGADPRVHLVQVVSRDATTPHTFEVTPASATIQAPAPAQAPASPAHTAATVDSSGTNGAGIAVGIALASVGALALAAFAVTARRRRIARS